MQDERHLAFSLQSSALYLYAIIDRPEAAMPDEPGLHDMSPLNFPYRNIAAVASPLTTTAIPPTEDNLWRHEAVVEALMADRAVLPVRFGTVLSNTAAVQGVLATHYADLVANLERVHGRVELGLRILWDDDRRPLLGRQLNSLLGRELNCRPNSGQPSAVSGRSYLLARLQEQQQVWAWRQRAETLAAELHGPLARLAAESTQQVLVTPRLLLTAAYLVERDRMAAFRQAVEGLNVAYPALRLLCTGPWPPYSFVTAPDVQKFQRDDT